MLRTGTSPSGRGRKRPGGFTLFEVLAALAVAATAITIGASLLVGSLTLGQISRDASVAAALAEERLIDLKSNPDQYNWADLAIAAADEWIELGPSDGGGFDAPSVLSEGDRWARRDQELHMKFTGKAYAKLRHATDSKIEIVVVVRWTDGNRPRSLALTSFLPRQRLEGTA